MLGCARHTAAVYDRGAKTRIGPLDTVTSINWERKRDDTSLASVRVEWTTPECRGLLASVEPNRHELVIFRDRERVWEGPISHIDYGPDATVIEARDVSYYLYRLIRRTSTDGSDAKPTLVKYMRDVLNTELTRRENENPPINVKPYIKGYLSAHTATTRRVKPAYSNTVFEEIDDIARYAGMDYTVIGRAILLFDTHTVFYQGPVLTEADFLGPINVTAYGLQHATYAAVTDGEGVYGVSGGPDPYYGHWEMLHTIEQSEESADTEPADPDPEVLAEQAKSSLVGLNPVPFLVRLPEGSTVNPNGALTMANLVPGARFPLRATMAVRTFTMMQKLDSMKVTEDAGSSEKITVNMSTASTSDEPMTGTLP